MRASGILYPVSSLPSRYGIGCFSKEAYEFVDFLHAAGQTYWQILPIGPTGFGDSPYQSFSTFAGNPYFICLETLVEEGLLSREACDAASFGPDPSRVDYGALYENRMALLRQAFARFLERGETGNYEAFRKQQADWLDDYALFRAIKDDQGGAPWTGWPDALRARDEKALKKAARQFADEVGFIAFLQYKFQEQWDALHAYAKERGVRIIGDMPLYVAADSADAWAYPEQFLLDADHLPTAVAGCPPDAFSSTGQLWGNPIYDWAHMKKDDFSWWVRRIARNLEFYDVIRIDHFNGLDEYYAIPYGDATAEHGTMKKGPGMALMRAIRKSLGEVPIIAEDLGNLTPSNKKLLADAGCPGMKVLQFAFDGSESSEYLTHRHTANCVVYTGTHDNTTTRAWIEQINDHDRDFARRYINSIHTDYGQFVWDLIREAHRSVADLCIIPIQDYLVRGAEARVNNPGTIGENWQWRSLPGELSAELARSIRALTQLYGRLPLEERSRQDQVEQ